jgi:hypothetical protein
MRHHSAPDWAKTGAPIAQVLNDTDPLQYATEPLSTTQLPPAAPFSGKLVDLLLDTPEQLTPNERKRVDYQAEESSRIVCENTVIKLPQPPKLPAKTAKRARIPPLLQGLHQPPPLPPTGRLFPPITDGASGFEQDICDRVQSGHVSQEARGKGGRENISIQTNELNERNEVQGEHSGDDRDIVTSSTSLVHNSNQETTFQLPSEGSVLQATAQNPRSRKRKKWSDEETRDLLLGVSRYGIGKWKKILHCSEFKFEGRTAVDLKDRFRVCCPGEGLKLRQPKRQERVQDQSVGSTSTSTQPIAGKDTPGVENTSKDLSVSKEVFAKGAGHVHRMSHPELAEMGIQTPFARSTRRPRQRFNVLDDDNLLKGFEKYGAAWHLMRDDKDLGFSARHPTDLRDRFRIRYPEAYARAGYKLKSKVKTIPGIEHDRNARRSLVAAPPGSQRTPPASSKTRPSEELSTYNNDSEATKRSAFKTPGVRSLPFANFGTMTAPFFLSENTGAMSADADGTLSPIILNRDILQWADANTSSTSNPTTSIAGSHMGSYATADLTAVFNDGIHINPLATLKLPLMAHTSHNLPTGNNTSSTNMSTFTNTTSPPTAHAGARTSYPTNFDATGPSAALTWAASSSSKASLDDLLRTPNLPTIVFPHVPAASARTTMHNLPTPADLLSGMDLETADGQGGGAGLEHAGLTMAAGSSGSLDLR